jgi:hypothetical protein
MINRNDNPVQWALFVEELNEAHEHLGKLISEMMTAVCCSARRCQLLGAPQRSTTGRP